MNLAQGIIEENKSVDVSAFDNFEVRTLKTYMKIMQEAYVKRVIEIFHLRPEDLDITPEYFCEIGFCNWQSLKVAFIQKVLMRSSYLQTDEPKYFLELKILKLCHFKDSNHVT